MNNAASPFPLTPLLVANPAPAGAGFETTRVLRFTDANLQAAIDRSLASLPPGTTGATLEVGQDADGIIVAGAMAVGRHWTITGVYAHRASGGRAVVGRVRWTPGE